MSAHMRSQISWLRENLIAHTAVPELLARMQSVFVSPQLRGARESTRALLAHVRLLTGVYPTVNLERFRLAKCLRAFRADVRTHAGMDSHVKLKESGMLETSSTHVADVWSGV